MDAGLVQRLFHPFERGVPAGSMRGLGLGLYITAQIVEAHGGKISVQSTPGVGSTFIVELPRQFDRKPVSTESAAPESVPARVA
jgi:signal transduction histidine kinase